MKKVFSGLIVLGFITITACGVSSSGGGGTTGQDTAAGNLVSTKISSSLMRTTPSYLTSLSISSNNTDASISHRAGGDIPEQTPIACETSGDITTTGTYMEAMNVEAETVTITSDVTTTFNACKGVDTRCEDMTYNINGPITATMIWTLDTSSEAPTIETQFASNKVAIHETGTLSVTLGIASAFNCDVDLTMNASMADLAAVMTSDEALALMTGTICGTNITSIKDTIEGTDTEYCTTVKGLN